MEQTAFRKMHGLGNDFVVCDARHAPIEIAPAQAVALADRRIGVGCDQIVIISRPTQPGAYLSLRFLNADGSESAACGNGTRCVAHLAMTELKRNEVVLETPSGLLSCEINLVGRVTVDMGLAFGSWQDIPLSEAADTVHVSTGIAELEDAVCVSLGNPHATFFVDDADAIDLPRLGPLVEQLELFPERVNVGVASLLGHDRIRLRVWERGTGMTLACGTAACASAVAANRRGLTGRQVEVVMERGSLFTSWRDDGHVLLGGAVATSFMGTVDLDALETV
jgi:diaminopimelate epimerase